MKSLSSVGLGLSLVFGCLLLALVAELYYLLWWKKRISNREIEDDYSSPAREFLYMFCWKKPSSLSSTAFNPQELCSSVRMRNTHVDDHQEQETVTAQISLHENKDLLLKPFEEDGDDFDFMRLNGLSGPPRFLFTIKEETKEDLESEDGNKSRGGKSRKGSRSRSLSDLVLTVETPFLTPLSSPAFFTPPLTPVDSSAAYSHTGFNPLYESLTDAEFNKIRSSPPPKFKFLQDAEKKLHKRKLVEEAEKRVEKFDGPVQESGVKSHNNNSSEFIKDEEDGSFITIIVAKNKEDKEVNHTHHLPQCHSSSSQVLPLSSSPSSFNFNPPANKRFMSN